VVGVPLGRGAAAVNGSLQRLSHEPDVAGVRQLIQDENEGFALRPQFVDAAQLAGQFGLTVDLFVRNHQIAEVTKLAELCSDGTFVLNHLGRPHVAAGQWTGWLHDIKAMAHLDNVRCKLSGLINPTGNRRLLMRRASGDGLGWAFSSGLAAALTRGPHR
jgi:L-fuconolactonase